MNTTPNELVSSQQTTLLPDEVARLTDELAKTKEKFENWKTRAKDGVDQLRKRIAELSTALEQSEAKYSDLLTAKTVSTSVAWASGPLLNGTENMPHSPTLVAHRETMIEMEVVYFFQKMDVVCNALKGCPLANPSSSAGDVEEIEKYKKRTAATMRLQAKNIEALQAQIDDLQKAIQKEKETAGKRELALNGRDEALGVLQQRLEASEKAREALEEVQAAALRGPDMEQLNRYEEQIEQEVNFVRKEFASREAAIFCQHHDEMERLTARYEHEIQQMRSDSEARIAQAVHEVLVSIRCSPDGAGHSNYTQGNDDAGYKELLMEYEDLREQLALEQTERAKLQDDLARYRGSSNVTAGAGARALLPSGEISSAASNGAIISSEPQNLPEARAVIANMKSRLEEMAEDLWTAKKTLMDINRDKQTSLPPDAMDAQQVQYLKSIIIRLLSAKGDETVIVHLLPVLSAILHFESSEWKTIYTANPHWIKS